jgi:hypothetical protein
MSSKIKDKELANELAKKFGITPVVEDKETSTSFSHMEHQYSKDTQIIRQACLKAASNIGKTAKEVIEIAGEFEKWVLR